MFKRLFAILIILFSVGSSYITADNDYVSYCIEKYNPDSQKDEFIQCIEDMKEASELFSNNRENSNQNKIIDRRDFLSPEAFKTFSPIEQKEILEAYKPYIDGKNNKAIAQAYKRNLAMGDAFGFSLFETTIENAKNQAIAACNHYKKRDEFCVLYYINDTYVLADNLSVIRNKLSQNNNRIDWSRAADFFAKDLKTNPAFGNTPPTRVCNFKNYEGEIITGDCKNVSIRKGNDTYWKIQ